MRHLASHVYSGGGRWSRGAMGAYHRDRRRGFGSYSWVAADPHRQFAVTVRRRARGTRARRFARTWSLAILRFSALSRRDNRGSLRPGRGADGRPVTLRPDRDTPPAARRCRQAPPRNGWGRVLCRRGARAYVPAAPALVRLG